MGNPQTCWFILEYVYLQMDDDWGSTSLFRRLLHRPSGYVKIAMENAPIYSGFSHLKMVIFHSYVKLSEGNHQKQDIHQLTLNIHENLSEKPKKPPFPMVFPWVSYDFATFCHIFCHTLRPRQIRLTRKSELQLGIAPKGGAWHPKAGKGIDSQKNALAGE